MGTSRKIVVNIPKGLEEDYLERVMNPGLALHYLEHEIFPNGSGNDIVFYVPDFVSERSYRVKRDNLEALKEQFLSERQALSW